jgi:hypothetical protein
MRGIVPEYFKGRIESEVGFAAIRAQKRHEISSIRHGWLGYFLHGAATFGNAVVLGWQPSGN